MLAYTETTGVIGIVALLGAPIFAIILGLMAIGRIEHSDGQLRGRGLAIGAVVMGILSLLALPLWLLVGVAVHRAPPPPAMISRPPSVIVAPPATTTLTVSR